MLRKFHEAKVTNKNEVVLWGTGNPKREFLHVDDLAKAVVFNIENSLGDSLYNIGSGEEVSIQELAVLIKKIVGYNGSIKWDYSKPDGTPRKLLDSSKINLSGWSADIDLKRGIESVYKSKF
jgi:GDP-L-fucose synthase